nr:hypothetical protein CFP56_43308 [Quercus suber]
MSFQPIETSCLLGERSEVMKFRRKSIVKGVLNSDASFLNKLGLWTMILLFDLSRTHYRHGMIRMLNVNTICKEGDIGLMIAITLNIRFRTSLTRTSRVHMLVSSVVWKEGMHKVVARPLTHYQRQ